MSIIVHKYTPHAQPASTPQTCPRVLKTGTHRAGKDHSKVLDEHVSSFMDKAKQATAKVGVLPGWLQGLQLLVAM